MRILQNPVCKPEYWKEGEGHIPVIKLWQHRSFNTVVNGYQVYRCFQKPNEKGPLPEQNKLYFSCTCAKIAAEGILQRYALDSLLTHLILVYNLTHLALVGSGTCTDAKQLATSTEDLFEAQPSCQLSMTHTARLYLNNLHRGTLEGNIKCQSPYFLSQQLWLSGRLSSSSG